MSCRLYERWLTASADGELGGWRAALLRSHVAGCKACSQELAGLRQVRELVASRKPDYAGRQDEGMFWQRLRAGMERVDRAPVAEGVAFFGSFPTRWLAIGAATAAVVLTLSIGIRFSGGPQPAQTAELPLLAPPGSARVEFSEVKTELKSWAGVVRFDEPDVDITVIWVNGLPSVEQEAKAKGTRG